MNHGARARAYERVALLGEAKLELPALFDEAGQLLAAAQPRDAGCWHAMDPASLIETSFQVERMPPPDAHIAEIAYLPSDYNSFVELANGPRHSGVLSEATGGDLERSRRYREVLAPKGIRGELRTAFVVDGACWGCCAFFREAPGDFSEDEREFAHALASVLGQSFRAAGVHARTSGPAAQLWPGVLVIDGNRRVESVTAAAQGWLREFDFFGTPERDPLPFEILTFGRPRLKRSDWALSVDHRSMAANSGGHTCLVTALLCAPIRNAARARPADDQVTGLSRSARQTGAQRCAEQRTARSALLPTRTG